MKILSSATDALHRLVRRLYPQRVDASDNELDATQQQPQSELRLIIGLGNPGEKYAGTRHNLGFEVVNLVASRLRAQARPADPAYSWSLAVFRSREIVLAKPITYMNRSGEALGRLLKRFQCSVPELLVVVDDINLPLGSIRIRLSGSDGGHRGLGSIRETVASTEFARIRLGVGPVPEQVGAVEFVLSQFGPHEQEKLREMVAKAAEAVIFALGHRLELTMSKYNSYPAPPEST